MESGRTTMRGEEYQEKRLITAETLHEDNRRREESGKVSARKNYTTTRDKDIETFTRGGASRGHEQPHSGRQQHSRDHGQRRSSQDSREDSLRSPSERKLKVPHKKSRARRERSRRRSRVRADGRRRDSSKWIKRKRTRSASSSESKASSLCSGQETWSSHSEGSRSVSRKCSKNKDRTYRGKKAGGVK